MSTPILPTKTVGDLMFDVLPRLNEAKSGISVYQAVNSITSLIYKRLLERNSDLIASGVMDVIVPAGVRSAPTPDWFSAFAGKPQLFRAPGLVAGLQQQLVTLGLEEGNQTIIQSMFTTATDISAIQQVAALDIPTVDVGALTRTWVECQQSRRLEPLYLDDDHGGHGQWWHSGYDLQGEYHSPLGVSHYKVIGSTIYLQDQHRDEDKLFRARYFQRPMSVSATTDTLQYSPLSYEVYREGVVLIITRGLAVPEADPAFQILFDREVFNEVNARDRILPNRRMKRSNWI